MAFFFPFFWGGWAAPHWSLTVLALICWVFDDAANFHLADMLMDELQQALWAMRARRGETRRGESRMPSLDEAGGPGLSKVMTCSLTVSSTRAEDNPSLAAKGSALPAGWISPHTCV